MTACEYCRAPLGAKHDLSKHPPEEKSEVSFGSTLVEAARKLDTAARAYAVTRTELEIATSNEAKAKATLNTAQAAFDEQVEASRKAAPAGSSWNEKEE